MTPLQIITLSGIISFVLFIISVILVQINGPSLNYDPYYIYFLIFAGLGINMMNCGNLTNLSVILFPQVISNKAYSIVLSSGHFGALIIPFVINISNDFGYNSVFGTWVIILIAFPATLLLIWNNKALFFTSIDTKREIEARRYSELN